MLELETVILACAPSIICIILVLIEYRYISRRGGLIDAIVFAVYSVPICFSMFTVEHDGDIVGAWSFLLLLSGAQSVILLFTILIFYIPKLLEYIRNRK